MERQSSQVYFRNPLTGQQMQIILYDLKASEEDFLLAWSRTARQFWRDVRTVLQVAFLQFEILGKNPCTNNIWSCALLHAMCAEEGI